MDSIYLPFLSGLEVELVHEDISKNVIWSKSGHGKFQSIFSLDEELTGKLKVNFEGKLVFEIQLEQNFVNASLINILKKETCKFFLTDELGRLMPIGISSNFNQNDKYINIFLELLGINKDLPICISMYDDDDALVYSQLDIIPASDDAQNGFKRTYCHGVGINSYEEQNEKKRVYTIQVTSLDGSILYESSICIYTIMNQMNYNNTYLSNNGTWFNSSY